MRSRAIKSSIFRPRLLKKEVFKREREREKYKRIFFHGLIERNNKDNRVVTR